MTGEVARDKRESPPRTDRLFFALRPDEEAAARIHRIAVELRDSLGLKGRPLPRDRLHVTLLFLGDHAGLPRPLLDAADAAAKSLAIAPLDIRFNHVRSFASHHNMAPLVMGTDEPGGPLHMLHDLLAGPLARRGFVPADAREYTPHITLLYDERTIARRGIVPVSWRAGDVSLVRSFIGKGHHEVLASYPLG